MTTIDWGHVGFVAVNIAEAFGLDPSGTDTSARWISAVSGCTPAAPNSGQIACLPVGSFGIKPAAATGVAIPATGLVLRSGPGTTIPCAVPTGDGHTDSPLYTSSWNATYAAVGALSDTAVEGSYTAKVTTVGAIASGSYVAFGTASSDYSAPYRVTGLGVTGTSDVTAAGLYGAAGTLAGGGAGLTLILNVNGAGATTLTFDGTGGTNAATEAAMLAAILVKWPALQIAAQGPGHTGKNLVLTATTITVGAGTANTALGLTAGGADTLQLDLPMGVAFAGTTTTVASYVPTVGIDQDFGYAVLSGTGGRAFWYIGCWGASVEKLNVQSSFTVFGPDFDFGGRYNTMRKVSANNVAGTAPGFAHEGGQNALFDECLATGFTTGFQIGGFGHELRTCRAYHGATGVAFGAQGAADTVDARYCTVVGGDYSGNTSCGVQIAQNSYGNTVVGCSANYNSVAGVSIATTAMVTQTTGASENAVTGVVCVGNGSSSGGSANFRVIGTGAGSVTMDGNTFTCCQAINGVGSADGFLCQYYALNTTHSGCVSTGNAAAGYHIYDATCTGTVYSGCVSKGNGSYGWILAGDAVLTGCTSVGDIAGGVFVSGAARVTVDGMQWTAPAHGTWRGAYLTASGECSFSGVRCDMPGVLTDNQTCITAAGSGHVAIVNLITTGGLNGVVGLSGSASADIVNFSAAATPSVDTTFWCALDFTSSGQARWSHGVVTITGSSGPNPGTGIYHHGSGSLSIDNLTVTGGIAGIYWSGSGDLHFGPGCVLSVAPTLSGSGKLTMEQSGGVATFAGTAGTTTLTFAQHYCKSIECGATSPIASGALTITALAPFIGQEFIVNNRNTGTSTTTVFGVLVPVGAMYLIRCNSAGTWEHVTLS